MRYIDQDNIEEALPDDWLPKAQLALEYVEAQMTEALEKARAENLSAEETAGRVKKARSDAISKKAGLWSELGKYLKGVMHDKCWYCETRETRSDMPVDHYRPKSSVAENAEHPGYWWLAFDWRNYRYSCTFCNSRRVDTEYETAGGKQDHFPVFNPPGWVTSKEGNWQLERPILLDPTNPDDTHLLTHHENGFPRETVTDATHEDHLRARESIRFYHLDHIKAVRERKDIARRIRRHYEEIQSLMPKRDDDPTLIENIRANMREIIKLVREDAEFCTAARIYLQRYRNTRWVEELLARNL